MLKALFIAWLALMVSLLAQKAWAAELNVSIVDKKNVSPAGTIVELVGVHLSTAFASRATVNQDNGEFEPMVTVIPQGSAIEFHNYDSYNHHVYSVSRGNQFDLPLYRGKPPRDIVVEQSGVVKLGCNIHDWMLAYVYVNNSELIVTTDELGLVTFTDLPAGDYEIRVWNPRLRNNKKALSKRISIAADQVLSAEISVSLRKTIRKPKKKRSRY